VDSELLLSEAEEADAGEAVEKTINLGGDAATEILGMSPF